MQKTGYRRFKIESKPAPHVYPIPNKFDVSARKIRLAAMLAHEAFEYRFNKEVVLSRPCIYGVFGGRFGGFKPLKHKCVRAELGSRRRRCRICREKVSGVSFALLE